MKLIHWLGWILLLGIVGLGASLVIFVLRFNPDRYRPLIESKLSEGLGLQTKLGALSLGWKDGLAIQTDGVQLQSGSSQIPFFEAESVSVQLDPFLLLRGKLILSKFRVVRPNVLLVKRGNGNVNWPSRVGRGNSPGARTAGLALLLSELTVEGGNLSYRDESVLPVQVLSLQEMEARVTQTFPGGPVALKAEGKISAEGKELGVKAKGTFHPTEGRAEFVGHLFEERVVLKGESWFFGASPRFRGRLEVRGLNLEELFSPRRGEVYLSGQAEGELTFEGAGRDATELKRSTRAKGELQIQNGAFRNLNVVDVVLSRITPLPALRGVLLGNIPENFQPLLQGEDTPFDQLRVNLSVANGRAVIPSLVMRGPDSDYLVEAAGALNFERDVNFRARLVLTGALSEFLMNKVNEISLLANSEGQLVIPFLYQGKWPSARPQPDVGYLAQQLIVEQGSQLLEKGLEALAGLREQGKI